jgi:hypothetical protein
MRAGFCDPDGEVLEIHDRRDWRRVNGPAKGRDRARETAIARMPQERGGSRRDVAVEAALPLIPTCTPIAAELDAGEPDVGMLAALLAVGQSGPYIWGCDGD